MKQGVLSDGLDCDPELCFVDDGYTGSTLIRPALERLRDQAAAGVVDRLYVLSPDRLTSKYAYQALLVEELKRCGVRSSSSTRSVQISRRHCYSRSRE